MNREDCLDTRDTLVPASYPSLVDEAWSALAEPDQRDTLIPAAAEQAWLELECEFG